MTFTASAVPSTANGVNLLGDVSWEWQPDGGAASPVTCNNPCSYSPSSGTMRASSLVNGQSQTRSIHIRFLCASTGNPLLDSLPYLDALKQAMDNSGNPDGTDQQNRREHGFHIDCPPGEACNVHEYPTGSETSTPCSASPPIVPIGDSLTGWGHAHPFHPVVFDSSTGKWTFRPGGMPSDSTPDNCPRQTPKAGTSGAKPFPSPSDFDHAGSYNTDPGADIPEIVIDTDNIYFIPGGNMTDAERKAGTVTIPRGTGSCRIP